MDIPYINTEFYRVIAIDPAVDKMGFAVLDVSLKTKDIFIRYAETIDGVSLSKKYLFVEAQMTSRAAKLQALEDYLFWQFDRWQPAAIVNEAPFLGRFPQSYAALVECVKSIQKAVIRYSSVVDLDSVDPPTAKKAVGVSGKSKEKRDVMDAILELPGVVYDEETCNLLELQSEHASDAVAVGYWKIKKDFFMEV